MLEKIKPYLIKVIVYFLFLVSLGSIFKILGIQPRLTFGITIILILTIEYFIPRLINKCC